MAGSGQGIRAAAAGFLVAVVVLAAAPASALALTPAADEGMWQTDGKVYAMTQVGNTLFIGGKFTQVMSADRTTVQPAENIAAIDVTTGAPVPGWAAGITRTAGGAEVHALAASADGTTLYVGGRFDGVNGVLAGNLAALATDTGAVSPLFAPPVFNRPVHALVVGSTVIYAGGAFSRVNGIRRVRLAGIAPDGSVDGTWNPSADDVVRSLALAPDGLTVFVGGHFTTVDAEPRQSVARVDAVTGALDPWQIPVGTVAGPQTGWTLLPVGDRLYAGFGFHSNFVAAFRLDDGEIGDLVWKRTLVGNVESLAMSPDGLRLFLGGHFGTNAKPQVVCESQGTPINVYGLVSMSPVNGHYFCDWVPRITPFGDNFTGVRAMLTNTTQLWVGGLIVTIEGVHHRGFARYTL